VSRTPVTGMMIGDPAGVGPDVRPANTCMRRTSGRQRVLPSTEHVPRIHAIAVAKPLPDDSALAPIDAIPGRCGFAQPPIARAVINSHAVFAHEQRQQVNINLTAVAGTALRWMDP
jgi:hypothetical protein